MKKTVRSILFVVVLLLGFVFFTTDVSALETSKWDTDSIPKLTTSEGLEVTYDLSKLTVDAMWQEVKGEITVNITIPVDYDNDEIIIAPEVFEQISNKIYEEFKKYGAEQGLDEDYFQFRNPFQAGDKFRVRMVINNLSDYDYYYEETSFEIFPTEPLVYKEKETTSDNDNTTDDKFFNQITLPEGFTFRRAYNTALQALIPNSRGRNMTDDVVGATLTAKGYNGIADYAKYLLDFYNSKYKTNYTRLDQFNKGIIKEMLSDVDPIYLYNEAYLSLFPNMTEKQLKIALRKNSEAKPLIDQALSDNGFSNPIDYLLAYYNKKYNTNAANLSEICADAINDMFSFSGYESGEFSTETNETVLLLAYNYFYNEGLGFYFDQKAENGEYTDNKDATNDASDNTGSDYSIGEYMRDKTKGDSDIMERAGTLKSKNEGYTISGILKNIGRYTPNAYLGFNFMTDMQLKYKAKYGKLIVRYVDIDGNDLLPSSEFTKMVGKDYLTDYKEIDGYYFVEIRGNESGKYIDGTIEVIYVYDRIEIGEIVPPMTGVNNTNSDLFLVVLSTVGAISLGLVLKKKYNI